MGLGKWLYSVFCPSLARRSMAGNLLTLDLDDKDKENFKELQESIAQAQGELSQLTTKLRGRNAEAKHSELTLAELTTVPDECKAYAQVGKMFLLQPLSELKQELSTKVDDATKDVTSLTDKRTHVEESFKKLQEDFQEFVKAHVVEQPSGDAEKKDDK